MKKFIVLILSLLLISSCSKPVNISEDNYEEVTFNVIEEKIKNKETFVYYLGTDSCSNCATYLKTLANYFTNHSEDKIYYVDSNEAFGKGKEYEGYNKELAKIAHILDVTSEIYGYESSVLYTPTTFKVINGEYAFSMIGAIQEELIESIFDLEFNNIIYNELDYEQTTSLLDGEEDYNFFITNEECQSCLEFKLFVNGFEKQEQETKLSFLNLNEDILGDNEKLMWLNTFIHNKLGTPINFDSLDIKTPTLINKRGDKYTVIEGIPSIAEFKEFLK